MHTMIAMKERNEYDLLNEKLKNDLYFLTQLNKPLFEMFLFGVNFWYNVYYGKDKKN